MFRSLKRFTCAMAIVATIGLINSPSTGDVVGGDMGFICGDKGCGLVSVVDGPHLTGATIAQIRYFNPISKNEVFFDVAVTCSTKEVLLVQNEKLLFFSADSYRAKISKRAYSFFC